MLDFMKRVWAWIIQDLYHIIGVSAGILVILSLIIALIVIAVKKKKKAKAAKVAVEAKKSQSEKPVQQQQPTAESVEEVAEVKPEPAVEEIKTEPVVERVEAEPVKKETLETKPKTPAKKPAVKKETTKGKKLLGKWIIEFKQEKEFSSTLLASNGEVMLNSEIYTTEEGARNGISTIINGIETGNFVIYNDKQGNFYYKLKTANNRLLCVGQIYKTKDQCLKAVDSVKRIAKESPIMDEVSMGRKYVDYKPEQVSGYEIKKGLTGKWKVETTEDGKFSAKLYANNGQLMLATEEVASKKSAEAAIESVKKNSLAGNFIVDKDKFGRFYYKLRNAQKSVICIGEAYDSLDSCISALESVRRFAYTATYASNAE